MARTSVGQAATRLPLFKKCIDCQQVKPAADFHQYRYLTAQQKKSRRLHSRCKACHNLRKRERLVANRTRLGLPRPVVRARPGEPKHHERLKPFVFEKTCSHCHQTKPRSEFYPNRRAPDGLRYECKACQNLVNADYVKRNPVKRALWYRRSALKAKYGITLDQFIQMVMEQGGRCLVCAEYHGEALCIDHCHTTNRVRGLLCRACNVALGNLRERRDVVLALMRYIDERC